MTPVAVLFARTDSVYKTLPAVAGRLQRPVRLGLGATERMNR